MAMASAPSGDVLTFDSGPLQARIFQGSGHLALAGPDLAGTPHANVLTFEPPVVTVRGLAARRSAGLYPRRRCRTASNLSRTSAGRTSRRD